MKYRSTTVVTFFCCILAGTAGCGDDLEDQPLQGVIDGEQWEYDVGGVEGTGFDDRLTMRIYSGDADPCESSIGTPDGASDRHVWAFIPDTPGEYELTHFGDQSQTIVFESDEADGSLNASHGVLILDEITDEQVVGSMHTRFDSDYEVEGNFELERCD